jgi:hypothetical protein
LEVVQLRRKGPLGRTVDLQGLLTIAAQETSLTRELTDEYYAEIELSLLTALKTRSEWCLGVAADVANMFSADQKRKEKLADTVDGGMRNAEVTSDMDPLLAASVELCTAAEAHCEMLILQSFSAGIATASQQSNKRYNAVCMMVYT